MLEIKLNVVNKREYAENYNYREIIIKLPKSEEELKKDFEYLGLDYNNLSIQDTHITECVVVDSNDPYFSSVMSIKLANIIEKANELEWTTPYQDIKNMFELIKEYKDYERDKLLAILELKQEQIANMKDAVKYGSHLSWYSFFNGIDSPEEYAEELVKSGELDIDDIISYIDLRQLGIDCIKSESRENKFTQYGLLFEKESNFINQEEEEFE